MSMAAVEAQHAQLADGPASSRSKSNVGKEEQAGLHHSSLKEVICWDLIVFLGERGGRGEGQKAVQRAMRCGDGMSMKGKR